MGIAGQFNIRQADGVERTADLLVVRAVCAVHRGECVGQHDRLLDGAAGQQALLRKIGDARTPLLHTHVIGVDAIEGEMGFGTWIEACDAGEKAGFAASRGSHKVQDLPGIHIQVDSTEYGGFVAIGAGAGGAATGVAHLQKGSRPCVHREVPHVVPLQVDCSLRVFSRQVSAKRCLSVRNVQCVTFHGTFPLYAGYAGYAGAFVMVACVIAALRPRHFGCRRLTSTSR